MNELAYIRNQNKLTHYSSIVTVKQHQKKAWLQWVLFVVCYIVVVGLFQLLGSLVAGVDLTPGMLHQTTAQSVIIALFGLLGTFLVLFLFMKGFDKEPFVKLGFQYQNHKKDIGLGVLVGLVTMAMGFLTLVFFEQIKFASTYFSGYELALTGLLFLLVAVMEEMLLRGYILRTLMNSFHKMVALIISASLFSFMHAANPNVNWISFLNLFLSGIILGLPYLYTRNLWFSISLHFSWNFFQSLFGFKVSGRDSYSLIEIDFIKNSAISGGEFGFEGSMLSVVFQVILICMMIVFFKRKTARHKNKLVL